MLKGKTALVTGGARGIGRAIVLRFAEEGANVAIVYASSEEAARETRTSAEAFGLQARCYRCDVSKADEVQATVRAAAADFGSLEILVNNAGITADALIPQLSEENFDRVIATNLKGAFLMTQQAYRIFFRKRYGRIINIASVSGIMGNAGQANYSAAKAGMIGLTKTTAKEMAQRGVTCNAIAPGFVETAMTGKLPEATRETALAQIPVRRMGRPEEVAALAAFLASDDAAYITGAVIPIDGGLNM